MNIISAYRNIGIRPSIADPGTIRVYVIGDVEVWAVDLLFVRDMDRLKMMFR